MYQTYETKQIPAVRVEMLARKSVLPEMDLAVLEGDPGYETKPTRPSMPAVGYPVTLPSEPAVEAYKGEPLDVLDEWILPND